MSVLPSISLKNLLSNETHPLDSAECIIGRNWLKCDDKRISRNHGILKVVSKNSISVLSTHQNPMFFRTKDDPKIKHINENQEVNLTVGDSFALLVDKFWFSIHGTDADGIDGVTNGNSIETSDPQVNGNKRRTSSGSKPDSTTKRVKTEPNEAVNSDGNVETTTETANDTTITTNGNSDSTTDPIADHAPHDEMPSTSNSTDDLPDTGMDLVPRPIKTEPTIENEAQSVRIKTEPGDDQYIDSTIRPIKVEVKEEPNDENVASSAQTTTTNSTATSSTQSANATPRTCCRYGIRCYRRNPLHRADEAHPGDLDYRMPDYPDPPLGAPPCPFSYRCYRRNPLHFQQFSHKPYCPNKSKDGYEATVKKPRRTTNTTNNANEGEEEDSEEDPFASDDNESDADFADPGSASESDGDMAFDADTDEDEPEEEDNNQ